MNDLISNIAADVRARMAGDSSHDWWHVWRVWQMARRLAAMFEMSWSFIKNLVL